LTHQPTTKQFFVPVLAALIDWNKNKTQLIFPVSSIVSGPHPPFVAVLVEVDLE
jgi:hypothetical protein